MTSSFSKKLDVLLQYLEERGKECVCAFVDIDSGAVWHQVLKFSLKHVSVFGLRGTFDQARQWTKQRLPPDVPRFAFSLGSTLSNAHPKKAQRNLQAWCGGYNPFGVFIGQDAPDEEDTLRNSYDKSEWSAFLQTGMRWLCTYLGASDVPDNAWVLDHGVAVSPRRHFFVFYFKKPIRFGHMTVPAESSIRVFDSYKYTTGEIADIAYAAKACVHSSWTQATSSKLLPTTIDRQQLNSIALYYIASETGDKPETEHLLHTLWLSRYLSDYVPITDLIARSVVESLEMAPSRQIELLFRNALRQRCPNAEFDPLQHDLNLTIRQLCSPQGSFSLEVNGPESREMIIGALGKLNGAYGHDWADLVTGYDGTCFAFAVAQAIGILCGKLGLNPPAEFHGWLAMINWLIEEDLTQNSPGH